MGRLADAFQAARGLQDAPEGVETALASAYARGRAAHPSIALDDDVFATHLGRCGAALDGAPEALRAEDLYLACACLAGVPAAVEHLRVDHHSRIAQYVRRFGKEVAFLEAVEEQLWDVLFVGGAAGPRLATYAGAGPLDRWLAVATQRIAISMRRHQDVVVRTHEELAAARRLIAPDPELDAIKDYYRKPFERAITAAIAALSDRDKAVYRMHLVDGVTLQNIGRAYGVHHTTVLRWLEAARERILEETKRLLRDELKVNAAEFDSLVRLLISQLNVNVSRILGADDSK